MSRFLSLWLCHFYICIGAAAITNGFSNAPSSVSILYSNFQCSGGETRLTDCRKTADTASCTHVNDAGVRCLSGKQLSKHRNVPRISVLILLNLGCAHGDLRITGSNSFHRGCLEVCYNNIWGQICDTQWDNLDAQVACRQLGFSPTG